MDLLFDYASYNNAQLSANLTPHNPPIQIPGIGGDFEFDISIENSGTSPITFDVWFDLQLPNGTVTGPILQRDDITLSAGSTISRENLVQNVPMGAPPGDYAYVAKVGQYPAILVASDTIYFEKFIGGNDFHSDGSWAFSGWEVEEISAQANPSDYTVLDVYPNPFNASTVIGFKLQVASHIELVVYDISGCRVAELVKGWCDAGRYEVGWDGVEYASGIYFIRLNTATFSQAEKVILLK
jgi:hypothetical protein